MTTQHIPAMVERLLAAVAFDAAFWSDFVAAFPDATDAEIDLAVAYVLSGAETGGNRFDAHELAEIRAARPWREPPQLPKRRR